MKQTTINGETFRIQPVNRGVYKIFKGTKNVEMRLTTDKELYDNFAKSKEKIARLFG